jgi:hypothetical protein
VNITTRHVGDPRLLYVAGSWIAIWIIFVLIIAAHFYATNPRTDAVAVELIADEVVLDASESPAPDESAAAPRPAMPV